MPIICNERNCVHHQLGECTLTRAAGPGDGACKGCAYFVRRGR